MRDHGQGFGPDLGQQLRAIIQLSHALIPQWMNLQLIEPKSDYAQRGSKSPFVVLAIDSNLPMRGERSLRFPYSHGGHEPS
ncbi:hypothetical protein D3C72_1199570 [compost metagenome]